jgi:putative Ca2+/H+ antiporter (TMEM165/GDT1 family)
MRRSRKKRAPCRSTGSGFTQTLLALAIESRVQVQERSECRAPTSTNNYDRSSMGEVWLVVLGAVLGAVISVVLAHFFPGIIRRLTRRPPVWVHVETDPARIWAGYPPWIGAGYLVPPDVPIGSPPPGECPRWWGWAQELGAVDVQTHILVTLGAYHDRVVVIDGVDVKVHSQRPNEGYRFLLCPVGGADITPRRIEITLAAFPGAITVFLDEHGERIATPTLAISSSEAERFHVWATAAAGVVEWSAELRLLVDGERRTAAISNHGRPFCTGAASGEQHIWTGTAWSPPL